MILSVPDEGYSRNVLCGLNLITIFLLIGTINLIYNLTLISRIKKLWNHNLLKIVPHRQEIKKTNI